MATVTKTGPAIGSGLRYSRLRLQMDRSDSTTSSSVRFRIWIETSNAESWSMLNLTVYGGWSSNGQTTSSFTHTGSYGWSSAKRTLVYDHTRTFTRQYNSTSTVEGSAQLTGIGAGQSPVRAMGSNGISMTIPARSVSPPNTPTNVGRSRTSNTQHTITWSASATTAQPIERFRIQRHDGLRDPNWRTVTIVYVSGNRSWTDTSTQTNTRYRWRIRAENNAGVSSWANSAYISTQPPTALTPTVRHQGGDNLVTVSRGGANMNVRSLIEHQSATATGSWSGWSQIHSSSTITAQNATITLRHVNVDPTRRHRYRHRLQNTSDTPTLEGSYSGASAIINLLQAPAAPTNVRPSGTTLDAAKSLVVSWNHNSNDGTDQIERSVRTRIDGGAWNTATSMSDETTWSMNSNRLQGGSTTDIQVRTRGEHPDWSPWSAISTVQASEVPQATIMHPDEDGVLTGSTVIATWEYFDPEGTQQAQWQATLYDAFDNPLEFRSGSGATTAVQFREQLEDNTTYQVGVRLRDGDRLWSEETRNTFSTEFALPPVPTFTAQYAAESGAVVLDIWVDAAGEDEVEASHVQVWRSIGSGRSLLIGDNIEPGAAFTDYLPHLVETNYYQVVAVSALPSVSRSQEIPVHVPASQREGWVYFNGGTGFQRVVRVRADVDVQITESRDKELRSFVGRPHPVEFAGEHRHWAGNLSVKLSPTEQGHASRTDMSEITQLPAPICYRDITAPDGTRVFVSLGELSHGQAGVVGNGSISFTMVEDPEVKHTDRMLATGQLPGSDGDGVDE